MWKWLFESVSEHFGQGDTKCVVLNLFSHKVVACIDLPRPGVILSESSIRRTTAALTRSCSQRRGPVITFEPTVFDTLRVRWPLLKNTTRLSSSKLWSLKMLA